MAKVIKTQKQQNDLVSPIPDLKQPPRKMQPQHFNIYHIIQWKRGKNKSDKPSRDEEGPPNSIHKAYHNWRCWGGRVTRFWFSEHAQHFALAFNP